MEIFLKGKLFSQQREPISVINPANGALIDTIPDMVEEDVDLAVATARAAFPDWARRSQWQRSGLIEKFCWSKQKKRIWPVCSAMRLESPWLKL